jgi:hypothetical protein
MKIDDCWTGGHEENLRFCAVNINHGPADVDWWGLASAEANALYEAVLADFGFDIHHHETLWWPDEYYMMLKGFNCYTGI